jgi:ATP-binding cassette, subfamily B, bacterial MsbA
MGERENKLKGLKDTDQLREAIRLVGPYFRPYKKQLAGVIVLAVLTNIFEPSLAVSSKYFTKYVFYEHNATYAMIAPIILWFIFWIRESSNYGYDYYREKMSLKVVQDLQSSVYNHFTHLSTDHFDRMSTGEMMSRTVQDVRNMQNTVPLIIDFFKQVIKLVALAAVCIYMQPYLTAVICIAGPIIIWPVSVFGRRMRKYTRKGLAQAADINSHMQETYSGARIVKAFSQEDEEVVYYRQNMDKMLKIQLKYVKSKSLQGPITNMITISGVAIVIYIVGTWAVANPPKIKPDDAMAFFAALGLMSVPLRDLAKIQGNFQTTFGSIDRVLQVFEMHPSVQEAPGAVELQPMQAEIVYQDVSFKYQDQMVLKNFNMVAKRGELIALVGPSGAGKTTVVNLLPRFYDVTEGHITIDGTDVRKVSLKSLRQQIGIVTQETFLFNDTVENNIKYGIPGRGLEQVVGAAQAANAHDFIEKLPAGYQTVIGERGLRLSGGERQRIAIARALLRNPPILLLDEATSSLDTESEREVQKALDNLMKNRTTIAIAHRLSTVRNADRIVVMENGEIKEQGTHEQLLAGAGVYRKLYEMQFLVDAGTEAGEVIAHETVKK